MKLPQSLTTAACSGVSPAGMVAWPRAAKSGEQRCSAVASPPATMKSLRPIAASGRPKTGAAR